MIDESSQANRRWEDDGGPAPPPRHPKTSGPPSTPRHDAANARGLIDLVVLPYREYSVQFRERIDALRERLTGYPPEAATQFVIVDTQRVERPGVCLVGVLHSAAGALRVHNRRLVLVGDLGGMLRVTRLNEVCPLFPNRAAAFRWCHNNLRDDDGMMAGVT